MEDGERVEGLADAAYEAKRLGGERSIAGTGVSAQNFVVACTPGASRVLEWKSAASRRSDSEPYRAYATNGDEDRGHRLTR